MTDDIRPERRSPPERPAPKRRWLPILISAAVGLALGLGAYAWKTRQTEPAVAQGQPAIGGDFQLVDQNGRTVDQRLLRGKWTAVFFGYTYCPDVCPATLQALQAAVESMGKDAHDVQVVFVTVDPARDTPQALKEYVSSFNFPGGIHALGGTPQQVDAAARAYRAYYARRGEGEAYLMDHFTSIYLMNPGGGFSRLIPHGLDPQQMAAQIRAAMAQGPDRA